MTKTDLQIVDVRRSVKNGRTLLVELNLDIDEDTFDLLRSHLFDSVNGKPTTKVAAGTRSGYMK